jgi:hypothetical protein
MGSTLVILKPKRPRRLPKASASCENESIEFRPMCSMESAFGEMANIQENSRLIFRAFPATLVLFRFWSERSVFSSAGSQPVAQNTYN